MAKRFSVMTKMPRLYNFIIFCGIIFFVNNHHTTSRYPAHIWYGMVYIYSTSLYIIYIAHHYNITQDAEREMHEVQYLYVAFP